MILIQISIVDIIKETNQSGIIEDFSLSTSLERESPEQSQPTGLSLRTSSQKIGSAEKPNEKNDLKHILGGLDSDINDSEPMYNALLEWLLHKHPTTLDGGIILDDTDRINSANVIYIMMRFYHYANETIRQKMISDIYMLIKWNSVNCTALLSVPEFHTFLLEVLYRYQLMFFDEELKDFNLTVIIHR